MLAVFPSDHYRNQHSKHSKTSGAPSSGSAADLPFPQVTASQILKILFFDGTLLSLEICN